MGASSNIVCSEIKKKLIISKQIMIVFSLMEIAIHYLFVLGLESLGFYVGTSHFTIYALFFFPSIWQENSKLNGILIFQVELILNL